MKELTIKEKKLDVVRQMVADGQVSQEVAEKYFPELKLKESDERIRKELIEFVKSRGGFKQEYIAWLEKQGEQKSADKVEPKFHKGDWIVFNGLTLYVKEVVKGFYRTITIDGIPNSYDWDIDNVARLWTIQDAKDGDVLASKNGLSILIFRNIDSSTSFSSYYNIQGKGELGWSNKCFIPATKEQRDQLEKAMADAGYTFDFEKKELKKIEPKSAEWSEEDDINLGKAIWYVENPAPMVVKDSMLVEWLKSLKGRVQPEPKKEWSEADEKLINRIEGWLDTLCDYLNDNSPEYIEDVKDIVERLNSLKCRYTWKPSDMELEVLRLAAEKDGTCLMGLYEQLKKL